MKVSSEPASAKEAGGRFHSVIVRGMKLYSNSLVVLRWWHSLCMSVCGPCGVLVWLSAGRSPRSMGVNATIPCMILYIRVRRRCCSGLLPVLLESIQPKVLKDGINAGPRGILALDPPCCSTLFGLLFCFHLILCVLHLLNSIFLPNILCSILSTCFLTCFSILSIIFM